MTPDYDYGLQKSYTLYLFFIFLLLCSSYVTDTIQKQELCLLVVLILFKLYLRLNLGTTKLVCSGAIWISHTFRSQNNIHKSLSVQLLNWLASSKRKGTLWNKNSQLTLTFWEDVLPGK